jgi:hypothetical protein
MKLKILALCFLFLSSNSFAYDFSLNCTERPRKGGASILMLEQKIRPGDEVVGKSSLAPGRDYIFTFTRHNRLGIENLTLNFVTYRNLNCGVAFLFQSYEIPITRDLNATFTFNTGFRGPKLHCFIEWRNAKSFERTKLSGFRGTFSIIH